LEFHNRVIEEALKQAIEKPQSLEITCSDFDGVCFKISTPAGEKQYVTVSIAWPAIQDIMYYGGQAQLDRLYPRFASAAEPGFDASVCVDVEAISQSADDAARIPRHISLLKRHLLAAPFLQAFAHGRASSSTDVMAIHYRSNEVLYLKPGSETVTVIFSIYLGPANAPNDTTADPKELRLFFKVFLQEFAAVRRTAKNAPAVTFSERDMPAELTGVADPNNADVGYVSFVLFTSHINETNQHNTIDMIQNFRDYLHYHIKCSKAYMHERMRARVVSLLQVLNRAKPEPVVAKSKKVWGGKTFAGAGTSKSLGAAAARGRGAVRGAPARGAPAAGRGAAPARGFAR